MNRMTPADARDERGENYDPAWKARAESGTYLDKPKSARPFAAHSEALDSFKAMRKDAPKIWPVLAKGGAK